MAAKTRTRVKRRRQKGAFPESVKAYTRMMHWLDLAAMLVRDPLFKSGADAVTGFFTMADELPRPLSADDRGKIESQLVFHVSRLIEDIIEIAEGNGMDSTPLCRFSETWDRVDLPDAQAFLKRLTMRLYMSLRDERWFVEMTRLGLQLHRAEMGYQADLRTSDDVFFEELENHDKSIDRWRSALGYRSSADGPRTNRSTAERLSEPMSKKVMAARLGVSRRVLPRIVGDDQLRPLSKQLFRVCLDMLPLSDREKLEGGTT